MTNEPNKRCNRVSDCCKAPLSVQCDDGIIPTCVYCCQKCYEVCKSVCTKHEYRKGIEKAKTLLKNWESKISDLLSPSKAIKALESQSNNLIISFESEVPGSLKVIDADFNITGYIYDLLEAAKLIAASEKEENILTRLDSYDPEYSRALYEQMERFRNNPSNGNRYFEQAKALIDARLKKIIKSSNHPQNDN